jgi:hypothetical protein
MRPSTWLRSSYPMWLFKRSSEVIVWEKKWRYAYEIDEERMRITVLFRKASARCSTPLSPIWLLQRPSVVSVCVKKWKCVYEIDEKKMKDTVLFRNAWARCSAPFSPIWLELRCSVVSVCVKKRRCVYSIDEERMRITVLFRNASARCCAASSPIPLNSRSSVVSVCVKWWVYSWIRRRPMWIVLPCFVVEQSLNAVLVVDWLNCIQIPTLWMSVESRNQVHIIKACLEEVLCWT